MAREECRLPHCDREPGAVTDHDHPYRDSTFCSPQHELKYDHLKDDARDARLAAEEEREP